MSEDSLLEEPWGQLISLVEGNEERIPIIDSKFTIGRGSGCDIVISNNKHVSSCHCSLVKDEQGVVWCKDTSTNGTLVDGNKVKRSEVKLSNSSVINIVSHKDDPKINISYKFVDIRSPAPDIDATLEMTQEYKDTEGTCTIDETLVEEKELSTGRKRKDTEDEITSNKKAKKESELGPSNKTDAITSLPVKPELEKKDSIEQTLICEICQEILHDCVSLQPCTHTYCGGCYSSWMEYSKECPSCRITVERITKNFIVNNLVEAYLRSHPDKKRSDEDLKELDEKNKITKDMLFPKKRKHRRMSWYDDDDEDDRIVLSSEDESYTSVENDASSTSSSPIHCITAPYTISTHSVPAPAPPPQCRQCPGYVDSFPPSSHTPSYTCSDTSNHIICVCCLQPMPDRRFDADVTIPPQKCDVCSKAYCHMYWGCRKLGCHGCLNLFKDIDFDESLMNTFVCQNVYESRVLKDHLRGNGLTLKDLQSTCLDKLDNGEYQAPDTRTTRISSTTRTCYSCAVKNFKELVYQYRKNIPDDELPIDVTQRPNCHWGRNCRTQTHNYTHAEKFSHVCPQTKF